MADVFISYSKAYTAEARTLAQQLEAKGFSVWWDTALVAGDRFRDSITQELANARAVVVIWSPSSIKSDWVISEADKARERQVLIPVRTGDLLTKDIPPPFDVLQTALVTDQQAIEAALSRRNVQPSGAPSLRHGALPNHLVILVHGINTWALWIHDLRALLERVGFAASPASYGRFSVLRFLLPIRRLHDRAITDVVKDIHLGLSVHKKRFGSEPAKISVIAHSFGTYVIYHGPSRQL